LDNGVEINLPTKNGWTPLHIASHEGDSEHAAILLLKAADVNAVNKNVETPLHLAAEQGHCEVVKALLAQNANVDGIDKRGENKLIYCNRKRQRKCFYGPPFCSWRPSLMLSWYCALDIKLSL
jgi:ankyrin repeat protein